VGPAHAHTGVVEPTEDENEGKKRPHQEVGGKARARMDLPRNRDASSSKKMVPDVPREKERDQTALATWSPCNVNMREIS